MFEYTVVKVWFNNQDHTIERKHYNYGLYPMTLKETQTFKTKMMNPNEYIIEKITDFSLFKSR